MKCSTNKKNSGYVAIISVIVIAIVLVIVGMTASLLSISDAQLALSSKKGKESLNIVEGCGEVALLNLSGNLSYTGGTITTPNGTCVVLVSGSGESRTITVTGGISGYVKKISISISSISSGVSLDTWKEVPVN